MGIQKTTHNAVLVLFATVCCAATAQQAPKQLPDAPPVQLALAETPQKQMTTGVTVPQGQESMTREQAEQMAIKNNPHISVQRLLAMAQHQAVRESRAPELPTAVANVTAMDAEDASRISAGSLTASRLFEHAGAGMNVSQLVTDFGRTRNLVASAKLQEKAQNATALATTEDIVLATDQAFYDALQAQAMLKVAQQNVDTRDVTQKQVGEMTKSHLKSDLDLSFASVNSSQAKLLQLDAKNNADSTMAALDEVLGLDHQVTYQLVDETSALTPPPDDAQPLIDMALQQRPDLQALSLGEQSAEKFAHAQRDQMLPSISALGTAGTVPERPGSNYYLNNWWGGVGVNVSIPVFNGFLYSAQAKEATFRAKADSEQARGLRNQIVRDVRTSWLAAATAYQRVSVTADLLNQANMALKLAETRYKLGLSSIVELSQAQYQQTDAAIGNTNAQYQYRLSLATLKFQTGATP
ncbi:TolC family protein [Silvibacterium acidisoli]|uniref:TolC family protein n=1 Tax=Acidobacteriaceae bacterium ZG23-2 TaxID=2883246 RepID=UPI00406C6E2F